MQRVPSFLTAAVRRIQPKRHGSGFKTFKELDMINKSTMDHLPKPSGSWEAGYRAKNSKANMALGLSIVVFTLTVVEMERQGCFDLLISPAKWSDKQVARQAKYYEKGNKWRKSQASDDDDE